MRAEVRRPGVPAEDLVAVVRVHADRVHDAVRRLGVDGLAAVQIVETTALSLVDAVARYPERVPDAVGWWFAEARDLATRAAAGRPELPIGGGLLAADEDQLVLAEAVEGLPADERLAVLLRDAYRLPLAAVAAALRVDEARAADVVARARAHAIPLLDDEPAPALPAHASSLGALGRLGEGGAVAPADATVRRHVQVCQGCAAVTDAQSRVHLLLSGLAVVALPEAARTDLLTRVGDAARTALPSAASLVVTDEEWEQWEDDDPRILPPLLAALGVVLAVVLGTVAGVLLSRGPGSVLPLADGVLPAVTLPPVEQPTPLRLDTSNLPPPPPVEPPRTRVFVLPPPEPPPTPERTAAPTSAPTPTPTATTSAATLAVEPRSGPAGATLRVTGTGWEPGARVLLEYLDVEGRPTGSRTNVDADEDGRFTAQLAARDPNGDTGRHTVRATSGETTRTAPYEVTG